MSDHADGPAPARRLAHVVLDHRTRPARATMTRVLGAIGALVACLALAPASALAFDRSFIGKFSTVTKISTTEPANGDKNPYGIVTVPQSTGSLVRGDLLISNFNEKDNLQGTGTTLVQITPGGTLSLFAEINPKTLPGECPGGVGLTTALAVLPHGYVVVGSLPTEETGKSESAKAGCLIVLDSKGEVVQTISGGPINGPWDLTSVSYGDEATLFVTNVLNGTVKAAGAVVERGTVVRIRLSTTAHHPPKVLSEKEIATGFPEATNEEALVVGPTGVGLGEEGTLYVADTVASRIAAVPDALYRSVPIGGGGITIAKRGYLNGPLGLTMAPNGDILTANGGDGNIVETTPFGAEFQPAETGLEKGDLFGLTVAVGHPSGVYFVNDGENSLDLLH